MRLHRHLHPGFAARLNLAAITRNISGWPKHALDTTTTVVADPTPGPFGDQAYKLTNVDQANVLFGVYFGVNNVLQPNAKYTAVAFMRAGSLNAGQFFTSGFADDVVSAGGVRALTGAWQPFTATFVAGGAQVGCRLQFSTNGVPGDILLADPAIYQGDVAHEFLLAALSAPYAYQI